MNDRGYLLHYAIYQAYYLDQLIYIFDVESMNADEINELRGRKKHDHEHEQARQRAKERWIEEIRTKLEKEVKGEFEDRLKQTRMELERTKEQVEEIRKERDEAKYAIKEAEPLIEDAGQCDRFAALGVLSSRDMEGMTNEEEIKHVAPGMRYNITNPANRHQMCVRYKSRSRPCMSKTLADIEEGEEEKNPPKRSKRQGGNQGGAQNEDHDGGEGQAKKRRKTRTNTDKKIAIPVSRFKTYQECERLYISNRGLYVHTSYFGNDSLRNQTSESVLKQLKKHAMCQKCMVHYKLQSNSSTQTHEYTNVIQRTQNCVICNKNASVCATNSNNTQVPVCNGCVGLRAQKAHQSNGFETQLKMAMEYLKCLYPNYAVIIEMGRKTGGHHESNSNSSKSSTSTHRYADCVLRFHKGQYLCNVIIECDEGAHKTYSPADEKKKFVQQAQEIIVESMTLWKHKGNDPKKVKTLFLRYNPSTSYKMEIEGKNGGREECISAEARLMVIRQHIIAWIRKLDFVRSFLVIYAFMDIGSKETWYPINDRYSGCGIVYQCPKPDNRGRDWEYCASMTECCSKEQLEKNRVQDNSLLCHLHERRVNWDVTFKDESWKESCSRGVMFPKEIHKYVEQHFPEISYT